jgi:hypothetical protein
MFVVSKEAGLAGMYEIHNEGLTHFDALCEHCQRSTPVSDEQMKLTFPNWEEEYAEMLKEADAFAKKQADLEKQLEERKKKPKKEKKKRNRKR